jgi:DNA-binding CsgD family transcriptional regulator
MSMAPSNNGFLLLDAGLNLIASNDTALQILSFASEADRIKQPKPSLAERTRTLFLDHRHQSGMIFVKELTSGKRRYVCKSFQVACNGNDSLRPAFGVLLERATASNRNALAEPLTQFGLTQRECETVEFLLQGLTSKEIATRMNISPNTVKAFLRLVMMKMKVSTRSGVAGKIAEFREGSRVTRPRHNIDPTENKQARAVRTKITTSALYGTRKRTPSR